jgi:hypothetical protein
VTKNVYWSSCEVAIIYFFFPDFNDILIFLTDFKKILKYQLCGYPYSGNQVVSCEQMDMKLTAALCNFANAHKKHKF